MGIVRSLLERREYSLNAATSVLANQLAGLQSASGVTVTPDSAVTYAALFACARVIAEDVASLPLITYRRLDRGKERAPSHPLYPLLHDAPNPEQTSYEWREVSMMHLTIWGNAYSEIVMRNGRPAELWPIPPWRVRVERDRATRRLVYYVDPPSGPDDGPFRLSPGNILHIPGPGFDGVKGMSPLSLVRETVGLGLAAQEFGARFFANDARPSIVLEHPGPGPMSDAAYKRLRGSFEMRHRGLKNAHRIALLEEGTKVHEIGTPPEDAQFLETRQFQVREIARFYRMQPHKIGDLEHATFSNIEHQAIEHVVDTVRPWLVRWEQRINRHLIIPEERGDYFVEFLVDGLLRGDTKSRYEAYAIGRQWGWLSVNDIRETENMNPIDRGGDEYLRPLNMGTAGAAGVPAARTNGHSHEPVMAGVEGF